MKKWIVCLAAITLFWNGMNVAALSDSAAASVLICGDTGEILYRKHAEDRLPMASTTKIMTALLLCEAGNLDQTLTVTDEMVRVEGSSMGLLSGDTVSHRDLLFGMMLASGNDAANVTAYRLGGSPNGFAEQMNRRAEQIGLLNTHFVTPSGLDDENHYTTALDLALLAREALKNPDFAAAASSEQATLCYGNPPYKRTLKNHNRLLKTYDGMIGVKTGFTKKSGRCLVTAAKRDGKYVIAVTLHDPNDWQDHEVLLDFGLSAVGTVTFDGSLPKEFLPVVGGTRDSVKIHTEPFSFSTASPQEIIYRFSLPSFLYAPVEKDEPIGTVFCLLGDTVIKSVPVYADESVGCSGISAVLRYRDAITDILFHL